MSDDYEVGYRKPPKHTRWKKGQSGNPRGRPKKPDNRDDMLERILFKPITIHMDGKSQKVSVLEGILTRISNESLKGDMRATKYLLDIAEQFLAARSAKAGQFQGYEDTRQILFDKLSKIMDRHQIQQEAEAKENKEE